MKKILYISLFVLFMASCVSTTPPVKETPVETPESTPEPAKVEEAQTEAPDKSLVYESTVLEKMAAYLTDGKEKVQTGSFSEGIKLLVTVLAEKELLESPLAEADELAGEAEIELAKIRAALSLEPESIWLDKSKNQISGSSIDLNPQPSVLLTINVEGLGRSLVAGVPVVFQFISGDGVLTTFVNTNDYGQASCKVMSFENSMEETIIRASLVYRVKGYTYRFDGVQVDFTYAPPKKRAAIFVMERSQYGVSEDPVILAPVFSRLKETDFDFSMYNSYLDEKAFEKVYSGHKQTIRDLALEGDVSYLVVVLNDCFNVKELEYNGKKLGMFYSESRATLRIIRVADGKILYQTRVTMEKSKNTHGQGGSEKKAVKSAIDSAAEAMGSRLALEMDQMREALNGSNTEK